MASWYGANGAYTESTPVSVNPGDQIIGLIELYNGVWYIESFVNGNIATVLNVQYNNPLGAQANGEWAMEVYNIDTCSQYPPSNSITLSQIILGTSSGQLSGSWSSSVNSNGCSANAYASGNTATITWSS